MARAWKVLKKREWALESKTANLTKAQLCGDNQGRSLRGPKSPLILPVGSHLTLHFPLSSQENLPQVTVQLGGSEPLQAIWNPKSSLPSLEITLPKTIQANELKVIGAGRVIWRRFAYVTYAFPLAPQVPAWRGVLDDACRWAEGARTSEEAVARLTHGLFASGRFIYPVSDPKKGATYVQNNVFALQEFLAHQGPSLGNCVDISDYLVICAAALGVPVKLVQLLDSREREVVTNPICPIGWDPSDPRSYQSLHCTMHQVVYLPSANRLFDACFFCPIVGSAKHNPIPTFSWEATRTQEYWQSEEGAAGLIHSPPKSVPQALVSSHSPQVR